MFATALTVFIPLLPHFAAITVLMLVVGCPLPGRGPRFFQRRDDRRGFKHASRRVVMSRAGHRCEGAAFWVWGRCSAAATEADHVYPWSRGGPTVPSNAQALCGQHNRSKGAARPPWWYLLSLERRRRAYFPQGTDVRVSAQLSATDARLAPSPSNQAFSPASGPRERGAQLQRSRQPKGRRREQSSQ